MEMAKVTSKGQITIPVSIRRRLQIKEGDNLLFIDRPEGVIMVNPDTLPGERADLKAQEAVRRAPAGDTAATSKAPEAEKSVRTEDAAPVEEASAPVAAPAADASAPAKEPEKPGKQLQGLDLSELLNEIRSIGSNI